MFYELTTMASSVLALNDVSEGVQAWVAEASNRDGS